MFQCNLKADISNINCLTKTELPPVFFSKVFGKGLSGNDNKISRTYVFVNDLGEKFTVYDWLSTSLYYGEEVFDCTPEQFWNDEEFAELQIGGVIGSNPSQFIVWLIDEYKDFRYNRQNSDSINVFRH